MLCSHAFIKQLQFLVDLSHPKTIGGKSIFSALKFKWIQGKEILFYQKHDHECHMKIKLNILINEMCKLNVNIELAFFPLLSYRLVCFSYSRVCICARVCVCALIRQQQVVQVLSFVMWVLLFYFPLLLCVVL